MVEKERSEKDVLRQDCNMKWTESFRIWSVWIDVAHIQQEFQCLIIRCFCCCHQTAFSFTTKGYKGRKRTTNKQNKQLVFKKIQKFKKRKRNIKITNQIQKENEDQLQILQSLKTLSQNICQEVVLSKNHQILCTKT